MPSSLLLIQLGLTAGQLCCAGSAGAAELGKAVVGSPL